jgi:hypothetical protein
MSFIPAPSTQAEAPPSPLIGPAWLVVQYICILNIWSCLLHSHPKDVRCGSDKETHFIVFLCQHLPIVVAKVEQAVEAHRVVRRRGSHVSYRGESQMSVRLAVLCAGHAVIAGRFLVLFVLEAETSPGP